MLQIFFFSKLRLFFQLLLVIFLHWSLHFWWVRLPYFLLSVFFKSYLRKSFLYKDYEQITLFLESFGVFYFSRLYLSLFETTIMSSYRSHWISSSLNAIYNIACHFCNHLLYCFCHRSYSRIFLGLLLGYLLLVYLSQYFRICPIQQQQKISLVNFSQHLICSINLLRFKYVYS